jgi:hypothetical protein
MIRTTSNFALPPVLPTYPAILKIQTQLKFVPQKRIKEETSPVMPLTAKQSSFGKTRQPHGHSFAVAAHQW